ncbi:MAG: DUF1684 domain-containing protein [Gemmatimonadales bacterium]
MRIRSLAATVALAGCLPAPEHEPAAPLPDLERERREYATWLETAPTSPYRALLQFPLADSLTIGPPGRDIPLAGIEPLTIVADRGRLRATGAAGTRPLARDRAFSEGAYHLLLSGPPGRTVLTVFGEELREYRRPEHFARDSSWRFDVTLQPGERSGIVRLLGPDGAEVEATDAGTVRVPTGAGATSLRVYRMSVVGSEESELEIFFRDATNGGDTYPAGRFVSLVPQGGDRYVLDFNRARNPFCAYNAAYACPAPWRGNTIDAAVAAGERYAGGGLDAPPS